MNIFILDKSPQTCAQYHCDKHVVKMTLETAQLLSTAGRLAGWWRIPDCAYADTHIHHPCVLWCATSTGNYQWLHRLGVWLGREYTWRYNKVHKSASIIRALRPRFVVHTMTTPPLCMPEQYWCGDVVQAYRNYYMGEKVRFARYTRRSIPPWFINLT